MASGNGITAEQIDLIKTAEKKRVKLQNSSMFQTIDALAYQNLFETSWLNDSEEYLTRFDQVIAADLAQLLASRLKYIKIAIAGTTSEAMLGQTNEMLARLGKENYENHENPR